MAKSSKSCGYTGHMHTMNKVNENKIVYQSGKAQSCGMQESMPAQHAKHKSDYPEVAAEQRAQAKCNCKK